MNKKNNVNNLLVVMLVIISIFISLFNFIFCPIDGWYIETPGIATKLSSMIKVNGKSDKSKGSYRLTSVRIMGATPFLALHSLSNPVDSFIPKSSFMGDANMDEYEKLQTYFLETSENNAKMIALKLANKPYTMKYEGVYVMNVVSDSNFNKKLKMGDIITKINDISFNSAKDMINYIATLKVGDPIKVTFIRDNKEHNVTDKLKVIKSMKKTGIGVELVTKTDIDSPEKIKINADGLGGPSAGMMFTLEIYQMLSGEDLRKGRNIAGTGEMLADGTIGRIGGIDKKVVAANNAGATIFLAPDDEITKEMKDAIPNIQSNYEEAKETAEKLKLKIKVVPVKTIQDAINYLKNTN